MQSKHNVSDKAGLLKLIRMCKEGIAVSELKDAYPGVVEDIEVRLTSKQLKCGVCNWDYYTSKGSKKTCSESLSKTGDD